VVSITRKRFLRVFEDYEVFVRLWLTRESLGSRAQQSLDLARLVLRVKIQV